MKMKLGELKLMIGDVLREAFYLKNSKTGVLSKKYPTKAAGRSRGDVFKDIADPRLRQPRIREAVIRVKVRDLVPGQFFSRDLPFARNFKVKAMGTDSDGFVILTTTDWMGHNARTHMFDPELEVFVGE